MTKPRSATTHAWKSPASRDLATWLRAAARAGALHGSPAFVRYSPPLIGLAAALVQPRARTELRHALRRHFGRRSALRESVDVARTFANYASCLAEALASERPEARAARAELVGGAVLQGLDPARGLVVLTAHTGAWDAGAGLLARDLSRPVTIVMRAEASAGARALHEAARREAGVQVHYVGTSTFDALPLIARLRSGGVVAMQLDRDAPSERHVPVSGLATLRRVPEGPLRLAGLAGAPLVTVFASRRGFFDYRFHVDGPVELPRRPRPEELQAAAQRVASAFERFVRAHPTQWFAFGR